MSAAACNLCGTSPATYWVDAGATLVLCAACAARVERELDALCDGGSELRREDMSNETTAVELTREETFLIGASYLRGGAYAVYESAWSQVPVDAVAGAVARGLLRFDAARGCYFVTRAGSAAYDALSEAQRQSVRAVCE